MITGLVEHRLLVNYRADADVVQRLLPSPFRPQLVTGRAVVGICILRLRGLRPDGVPERLGLVTDNAAHRFAVEWDGDDGPQTGVYIERRDTQNVLTVLAGGRLFPGVHHAARFDVAASTDGLHIAMRSRDHQRTVDVDVAVVDQLVGSELFGSTRDASTFFESGSIGWSPGRRDGDLQGVELCTNAWRLQPVDVRALFSSYFGDSERFPAGSIDLDCALLMRNVPVTWRRVPRIRRDDGGRVRTRRLHHRVSAGTD